MSILIRSGEIKCEFSSRKLLHFAEAASRIIAGAIAGGLAALAIKGGWLLNPVTATNQGKPTIIIAAFAAGYIERFATSFIADIAPRVAKLQMTSETSPPPASDDKSRRGKA
ncbi:MAG: hypothetical protein AB1508_05510 [Pseudomonadota bacterium]